MSICWIGIGANIGDAQTVFSAAWQSLERQTDLHLHVRSGIYYTRPVGLHAGGTFSNAVFSLETELPPIELLDRLQAIETNLGRARDVRWGPRPIDLDLLYVDQQVLNEPRLTVPHPAAWYRRFVLDPLTEVAPGFRHPLLNLTMIELRSRWIRRPLVVAVPGSAMTSLLVADSPSLADFPDVKLVTAAADVNESSVFIRLNSDEPQTSPLGNIPVADLTNSPGDTKQRVIDFLVAILDQPCRVSDWK